MQLLFFLCQSHFKKEMWNMLPVVWRGIDWHFILQLIFHPIYSEREIIWLNEVGYQAAGDSLAGGCELPVFLPWSKSILFRGLSPNSSCGCQPGPGLRLWAPLRTGLFPFCGHLCGHLLGLTSSLRLILFPGTGTLKSTCYRQVQLGRG